MDGVLRVFDREKKLIDYHLLSPEEITIMIQLCPADLQSQLEQKFQGVDGRIVTDQEQLLHPSSDLMPPSEAGKWRCNEINDGLASGGEK
jgi:hypothetical protein